VKMTGNYILRYAAGANWLVKADQQDADYVAPLMINEVGAVIWKGIEAGYPAGEITVLLQNRYQINLEEARSDVEEFLEQLQKCNIITA
jgi:hypothetical protein